MKDNNLAKQIDTFGEDHIGSSTNTPLRIDAFEISDEEKIAIIEKDMKFPNSGFFSKLKLYLHD
jgi:GTP cyclohydrolase I